MKKDKLMLALLLPIVILFLLISCVHSPRLVGKWQETGKTATIEFLKDGSFKAVDNIGMAVGGKYTLLENEMIRFAITREGSSSETVEGKLSIQKDELIISFEKGKEVERYKRVK